MMQRKIKNCLKGMTNIYIILILVLLPLYMKDRMVMIGDAKYYFFRNFTMLFLSMAVVLAGICGLLAYKKQNFLKSIRNDMSLLDWFVLTYGVVALVSCGLSEYTQIAVWGYTDWHMGMVTQVMLVGVYFAVSRLYDGAEDMWETAGIAATLVFALGVLNRFQIDPLGIYEGMKANDWNRFHLLSTIGNNNWYCGYLSVTAGILVYLFYIKKGYYRALAGCGVFLMYITLLTQGSESGYVLMAGVFGVLCYVSIIRRETFIRFWETVLLFPTACLVLKIIHIINPKMMIMDDEGTEGIWALWNGWILVFLVVLIIFGWFKVRQYKRIEEKNELVGHIRRAMIGAVCVGVIIVLAFVVSGINLDWGTGRGTLWYVSIRCFIEGDIKQKMIGAGPDCFAPYVYMSYNLNDMIQVVNQWKDVIYASAHNEWLNMLVTQGLLGMIAYLGIFITAVFRYLKRVEHQPILLLGLLALGGYVANATFSCQHVMTTPFIFVMIGMTEAVVRAKKA